MNLTNVIAFSVSTNEYGSSLGTSAGFINVDDPTPFEQMADANGRFTRPLDLTLTDVTLGTRKKGDNVYLNVRAGGITVTGYAERASAAVTFNPAFKPDAAAKATVKPGAGTKAPAI